MENQLQSKGDNGESENPETIAPNNYQLTNEEGTKTLDQVENKSEAEDDQEGILILCCNCISNYV